MSTNYKKLLLDRSKIVPAVEAMGVTETVFASVANSNGLHHLNGSLNGIPFLVNVYFNKDGTVSLSKQVGKDEAIFEAIAAYVVSNCQFSKAKAFNFSLQKSAADGCQLDLLEEFLQENGCKIDNKETTSGYTLTKWTSPYGDSVTIKQYTNKTIQFQGKNGLLASLIWDFVVVNAKDGIQEQLNAYEIPTTLDAIAAELVRRLPSSHGFIHEKVRKQLSSALSMTKVKVSLDDYGLVAFPALRGLEGYLIQSLVDTGFAPEQGRSFYDYFEKKNGLDYSMPDTYAEFASKKGPKRAPALCQIYNYMNKNRHRAFHMDATIETSKITSTLVEATQVVDAVLQLIEQSYTEMRT